MIFTFVLIFSCITNLILICYYFLRILYVFIYLFQNALKSCKQQSKNLADMAKEIEVIERVTSPGDLPSRLEAAENATVDVEKRLAKTVSRMF